MVTISSLQYSCICPMSISLLSARRSCSVDFVVQAMSTFTILMYVKTGKQDVLVSYGHKMGLLRGSKNPGAKLNSEPRKVVTKLSPADL